MYMKNKQYKHVLVSLFHLYAVSGPLTLCQCRVAPLPNINSWIRACAAYSKHFESIGAPHAILKVYRVYPYTIYLRRPLVYSIGVGPIYFQNYMGSAYV